MTIWMKLVMHNALSGLGKSNTEIDANIDNGNFSGDFFKEAERVRSSLKNERDRIQNILIIIKVSNNSLQQLDSLLSPNSDSSTNLIQRHNKLLTKDINSFTVEDLRFMIGQKTGLRHLIPLAVNILETDLFAEGDFFEGDLLLNILLVDSDFWISNPELAKSFHSIIQNEPIFGNLDTTREIIKKITTARNQFLSLYKCM